MLLISRRERTVTTLSCTINIVYYKSTTLLLTVRAVLDAVLPETIIKGVHPTAQIASSLRL